MKTKTELLQDIDKIPTFILRNVAVEFKENDWLKDDKFKAVCEDGSFKPLCFPTKQFNLIQFKEAYLNILNKLPDYKGYSLYYGGNGILNLIAIDDTLKNNDGIEIGLLIENSVNMKRCVMMKFFIIKDGQKYVIPSKIYGIKVRHIQSANIQLSDFTTAISNIKNQWGVIFTKFNSEYVTPDLCFEMIKELKIKDKNIMKGITKKVSDGIMSNKPLTLWEFFIELIKITGNRKYKTGDYGKEKKENDISELMFKWAIIKQLI